MKDEKRRLTERQLRFIELWTGTATETAALVGYSNPETAGKRCMKNVQICTMIKEKRDAEIKPAVANRQDRQKFWTDVLKDTEQRMPDRLKASELLGKSEGDFLDRVQHSGDANNPVIQKIEIEFVK